MPQLSCVLCLQSAEEQRTRAAAMAAMQRLPEGVNSIHMPQPAGVCHVCQTEDYTDDNPLLQVGQGANVCHCLLGPPHVAAPVVVCLQPEAVLQRLGRSGLFKYACCQAPCCVTSALR